MKAILALAILGLTLPPNAHALILVKQGDEPVKNLGWPKGAEDVANLPGRLGYWEGPPFGGGQYFFEFPPADTATVQTAIDTLATVESDRLQISIVNAAHTSTFLEEGEDGETKAKVGYTFTVWIEENWDRLYNNKDSTFLADHPGYGQPVPGPLLTVYVTPGGEVDPDKLTIPDNVKLSDSRLSKADLPDHLKHKGNSVVTGHVTDLATGLPVAGAEVTLASSRPTRHTAPLTTTGADGSFTLVWAGGHHAYIHATAAGYAPRRSTSHISLLADTLHDKHHLTLAPIGALSGTVTTTDGEPLPGAEVRASSTVAADGSGYPQPEIPPVTTGDDGSFTLTNLPKGGSVRLRVRAEGWYNTGSLTQHEVAADKPADVQVVGTGTISGTVAEHPMERFKNRTWNVKIQEQDREGVGSWGGSCNCKPDRTFTFKNVPAGTYVLVTNTPKSPKIPPATPATVTVVPGQTTTVTLIP